MGKNYIEYNLIEYEKNGKNDVANPDNYASSNLASISEYSVKRRRKLMDVIYMAT